jgi:L-arabinokinase
MGKKIIQTDGSGPPIQALTDLTPTEFEEKYMHLIPDTILGTDFLSRYHSHDDPATKINLDVVYEVKHATCHPIYENSRVKRFTEFIRDPQKSSNGLQCELMGELMYESHQSYSNCGLGSSETDLLVNLARNIGPSQGIFGAKISGGGCGGTVCILTTNDSRAEASIQRIRQEYQQETGIQTYLFRASSGGSRTFGTAIVTLQ